jgi:cytochrome c oxidase subunit 2
VTIIPAALRSPARILTAAFLATLLLPATAFADFFSPEDSSGSPNAEAIDTLYWIVFIMAMLILVGVWIALLYSMIKFRARRGAVPAQIRGNTRLEIGWTVGAALILVVIAIVTFVTLDDIRNAPESSANGLQLEQVSEEPEGTPAAEGSVPPSGKSLRIRVTGQQYVWRYLHQPDDNPIDNAFSYEELVVPVDTTVTLEILAQDVIHSWWIPALGGKMDAVPGHTNWTWFKIPAEKAGQTFRGQCAELCGRNHANMIAHVRAVTPDEYEDWVEQRKREIEKDNEEAAKQRDRIANE